MRFCFFVTAILWSVTAVAAEAAPPSHVQVRLVSETDTIRRGQIAWVAVVLTMEDGWHTYWRNPGDAGIPTKITWTLPRNIEASPIEWPVPKRFDEQEVTSYGYDGQVLLLAKLTPSQNLVVGQPVKIGANVEWLECRQMCLNGSREVSLDVPVQDEVPSLNAEWADAFAKAKSRLPRDTTQWEFTAERNGKKLLLMMRYKEDLEPELASVQFFPFESGVIEHNAPQRLMEGEDLYTVELVGSFVSLKPIGRLQGVLEIQPAGDSDTPPQLVQLDVPIVKPF